MQCALPLFHITPRHQARSRAQNSGQNLKLLRSAATLCSNTSERRGWTPPMMCCRGLEHEDALPSLSSRRSADPSAWAWQGGSLSLTACSWHGLTRPSGPPVATTAAQASGVGTSADFASSAIGSSALLELIATIDDDAALLQHQRTATGSHGRICAQV